MSQDTNVTFGVMLLILGLIASFPVGVLLIVGGLKMRRLDSYPMAIIGSIAAALPFSPTCLLGLPLGIWSLVVLLQPNVRRAFAEHSRRGPPSQHPNGPPRKPVR